jgi:poly[(R)-3-hydroxyalkanoate] polymerase subunit PhaC
MREGSRAMSRSDLDNIGERLNLVLTESALGPIRRWIPGPSGVRLVTHLATRPRTVRRRAAELVSELSQVVTGASAIDLRRDRRFADDEWTNSPVFRRVAQGYLAAAKTVETLVADAELDYKTDQRVRFLAENAVHA